MIILLSCRLTWLTKVWRSVWCLPLDSLRWMPHIYESYKWIRDRPTNVDSIHWHIIHIDLCCCNDLTVYIRLHSNWMCHWILHLLDVITLICLFFGRYNTPMPHLSIDFTVIIFPCINKSPLLPIWLTTLHHCIIRVRQCICCWINFSTINPFHLYGSVSIRISTDGLNMCDMLFWGHETGILVTVSTFRVFLSTRNVAKFVHHFLNMSFTVL